MKITEPFAVSLAHHLPTFPEGHKCRNVHGHNCIFLVTVDVGDAPGYAFDHADLRSAVWPIVAQLDHAGVINDIAPDLADGLAESQLRWLRPQIEDACRALGCVLVELSMDEGSSHDGVFFWHRKSVDRCSL